MSFILSSASMRRQQLLKYLISKFKVITADINEEELGKLARTPQEMVMGLARAKAEKVWDIICREQRSLFPTVGTGLKPVPTQRANIKFAPTENIVILGADTTVVISDGGSWQSIGKPKDEQDAKQIIQKLRGRSHQVYTGISLILGRGCRSATPTIIIDFDISTVTFSQFDDKVIDDYIATGTVMDKAGAYAIQDIGKEFGITVEGSYSNVVGLPMERLVKIFDKFKMEYNQNWQKIANFQSNDKK